jgi:type I restriction enzyme, R subunit
LTYVFVFVRICTSLTEQDIRTNYVTPAIQGSGWYMAIQVREEITFTAGRLKVRGRLVARGEPKRADFKASAFAGW